MSELNSQEKQCSETLVVFYWKIFSPHSHLNQFWHVTSSPGVLMCFWCIREEFQKLPFPARNLGYRVDERRSHLALPLCRLTALVAVRAESLLLFPILRQCSKVSDPSPKIQGCPGDGFNPKQLHRYTDC